MFAPYIWSMEETDSIHDLKEKFFIVSIKNSSKWPITMDLLDSSQPYVKRLTGHIHSDEYPLTKIFAIDHRIAGMHLSHITAHRCQDFNIILDLMADNIKFPLELVIAGCTRIGNNNGFNEVHSRLECKIEKEFNRKTIILNYNGKIISIDGKNIYQRTDL